jgi:hypothetical protein
MVLNRGKCDGSNPRYLTPIEHALNIYILEVVKSPAASVMPARGEKLWLLAHDTPA